MNARETLATYGAERLSPSECLALLIGGKDAEGKALRLFQSLGGFANLACRPSLATLRAAGLSGIEAERVAAALQLAPSLAPYPMRRQVIRHGGDVASMLATITRGAAQERIMACTLDSRHRLIAVHTISVGTIDSTAFAPSDVLRRALEDRSAAIVLAHNHPSGDPTPSAEDRAVTERMRNACETMGIRCLDHLVIGGERYYSFADEVFSPYRHE